MVKVEPDVDEIYPFWLDAREFFNTDNEDVLRKMVDNKETVKINIFINSQTNEVIGITKSNASKLALFYRNNKLVKFGFIIIPCVDLLVFGSICFSRKKKGNQKEQK